MANLWRAPFRRLSSIPLPDYVWEFFKRNQGFINYHLYPLNRIVMVFNSGTSMMPTLSEKRELRWLQGFEETSKHLKVGDVVCAILWPALAQQWAQEAKEDEAKKYGGKAAYTKDNHRKSWLFDRACKRIVAMPGDTAYYCRPRQGKYLLDPSRKVVLEKGSCWLVGDNRPVSRDSRQHGPISLASIQCKILWRWGPDGFNWIDHSWEAAKIHELKPEEQENRTAARSSPKVYARLVGHLKKGVPGSLKMPDPSARRRENLDD